MKRLLILLPLTVAACSQEPQTSLPPQKLEWQTFADGSLITSGYIFRHAISDAPSGVIRCWPVDGGYDCLEGSASSDDHKRFSRKILRELPTDHNPNPTEAGYTCAVTIGGGYVEKIRSASGEIKVNADIGGYNRAAGWTKAEVNDVLKQNGITPKNIWMDCVAISDKISGVSLAAVLSTEVTRELIAGPD